ncbi:MAG: DAK2 domain-containing protein [Ignavibacteriales bacterium]
MEPDVIDAAAFCDIIRRASCVLEENRSSVDALNVFPVPDGDTGTNMNLTMKAAVEEIGKSRPVTLGAAAEAAAMGSLMGARGNSGVILSQLFRGISRALGGKERATAAEIAWAMQEGVATAYKAVMKPVEGTILTVAREAAGAALSAAKVGAGVAGVWEAALGRAQWILERTPDMLPVLKQAGVVDAGGKGLVYILTGACEAVKGAPAESERKAAGGPSKTVEFKLTEKISDIRFPYDTQLLVKGKGLQAAEIRSRLEEMGDSLLVVGGNELVRVHVHTANPGKVLECCLAFGTLADISIENMQEQHDSLREAETAPAGPAFAGPAFAGPPAPNGDSAGHGVGIVAVSLGDGLSEIFRSLGADEVINGGQTMNPSTEDVLNAVRKVPAEKVILLPNNGNIILAAKQAKKLAGKRVYVVPTKTIPQGLSALLAFKSDTTMEMNLRRMAKAVRQVRTGEVTYAVRKTRVDGVEVSPGDILGIWDGSIAVTGSDPDEVLTGLAGKMVRPESEILTVFYGDLVDEERAARLEGALRTEFPELDIEFRRGGQPLYYYIMSVE